MGRYLLLLILVIAAYFKLAAHQQPQSQLTNFVKRSETVIYLVRHAEKDLSNPSDQDPALTSAGLQRAEALKILLQNEAVAAYFSTPYKRTQQTVAPLAQGRPIQFYEAHNFENLKTRILTDFAGKTIVVVGHSNTLLPIVEAFGAKKPMTAIPDNQYDNLFKITISARGKASVQVKKFGAPSV